MTARDVFLYPAEQIYGFILSLFGMQAYGLDPFWDRLIVVLLALLIWLKLGQAVLALIKHLIGLPPGRGR